jgi:hypothetical protein
MQPYDCRDLVWSRENASETFPVSELILGNITGDRDFRFRKIRLTVSPIRSLLPGIRLSIRHLHEVQSLFTVQVLSTEIHAVHGTMDILGEERILQGESPELADAAGSAARLPGNL